MPFVKGHTFTRFLFGKRKYFYMKIYKLKYNHTSKKYKLPGLLLRSNL